MVECLPLITAVIHGVCVCVCVCVCVAFIHSFASRSAFIALRPNIYITGAHGLKHVQFQIPRDILPATLKKEISKVSSFKNRAKE